jgi:hypothetical protein
MNTTREDAEHGRKTRECSSKDDVCRMNTTRENMFARYFAFRNILTHVLSHLGMREAEGTSADSIRRIRTILQMIQSGKNPSTKQKVRSDIPLLIRICPLEADMTIASRARIPQSFHHFLLKSIIGIYFELFGRFPRPTFAKRPTAEESFFLGRVVDCQQFGARVVFLSGSRFLVSLGGSRCGRLLRQYATVSARSHPAGTHQCNLQVSTTAIGDSLEAMDGHTSFENLVFESSVLQFGATVFDGPN